MGKSKGNPQVADILASIDYGVCHGPVDAINQVWVKDRPIWCGRATERQDIEVSIPDLFGGDFREGGVVGDVEFYPGTDLQMMSYQLASRYGLDPLDAPGYRGICHLFFRSRQDVSFPSEGEVEVSKAAGFRWGTNNPYLPATKVNVSRCPRTLGDQYSEIWPFDNLDPITGEPASSKSLQLQGEGTVAPGDALGIEPPWFTTGGQPGLFIDLAGYGLSQSQLDLGGSKIWAYGRGRAQNTLGQDVAAAVSIQIFFHPANPDGTVNSAVSIPTTDGGTKTPPENDQEGNWEILREGVTAPPGARYIQVKGICDPYVGVFVQVFLYETWAYVEIPLFEWKHCRPDGKLGALPNANPAHILHECLLNAEWGLGESEAMIDLPSFQAAAATLYDEGFGLSMKWMAQTEIQTFMQEVLDHIKAALFKNPATGLWEIKLLRDDYDVEALETLGPSNCKVVNSKRRAWGETVNEINVSYTDPQSETDSVVTSHNLANIQVQGGIISETRNYYGIRDRYLAKIVADRDVLEAGTPLWTGQIEVDRRMWNITPASVFKLVWPEEGIDNMVVRVMRVNYGSPRDRKITLDVVEDIFALEQTQFVEPQESLWVTNSAPPEPLDAETPVTAPLPALIRQGATVAEVDAEYPVSPVLLLADHDTIRPLDIDAYSTVRQLNGSDAVEKILTFQRSRSALLAEAMIPETLTTIPEEITARLFVSDPKPGALMMLGEAEADSELLMLDTYDSVSRTWSAVRGIFDTVPRDWPVGSRIWAFPEGFQKFDPRERAAGDEVDYRFLMRTKFGRLSLSKAPLVNFTVSDRPHLPFRPANAQLDGQGFGGVAYTDPNTNPATVTATWVNRNRTIEDQTALRWADPTVTGETGQTTRLRITDDQGVVATEYPGLAGTSYAIPFAALSAVGTGYVEFWAERDGLLSFQAARRSFVASDNYGYGANYGVSYG